MVKKIDIRNSIGVEQKCAVEIAKNKRCKGTVPCELESLKGLLGNRSEGPWKIPNWIGPAGSEGFITWLFANPVTRLNIIISCWTDYRVWSCGVSESETATSVISHNWPDKLSHSDCAFNSSSGAFFGYGSFLVWSLAYGMRVIIMLFN